MAMALAARQAGAQSNAPTGVAVGIASARAQYDAADFDAARRSFRGVLAEPTATTPDRADAHRYLAAIDHASGDFAAASRHVGEAIELQFDSTPPPGSPAALDAMFTNERARVRRVRSVVAAIQPTPVAGSPVRSRSPVPWIGLGIGAGVLVAGVVVLSVLLTSQPGTPMQFRIGSIVFDPPAR